MIRQAVRAIDDRLGGADFARKALRKAFPDHWSFMLGEIALYCFIFLVVSGLYLSFFFDPSQQRTAYGGPYLPLQGTMMSRAYESTLQLSISVPAGLFVRQLHHWAALVFAAAIVAHACRIFFTGAFRRPREINWLIGLTLLLLGIAAGFTGYSLPDDLLSGTGLRIAYSVALSIPFVGTYLAYLFFGGPFPSDAMTHRLFVTHVLVIPAAIAGAMAVHLAIIWRQKHTQFRFPGRTERNVVGSPLWPNYALKSLGLAAAVAAVMAALAALVQINPVWLYGPYNSWVVSAPAQPDWYIGWLEGALRLGPPLEIVLFGHTIPAAFWPAILLPLVLFAVLFLWPFIERGVTHDGEAHHLLDHPSDAPLRSAIGCGILAFFIVLTLAASDDVQARFASIDLTRVVHIYLVAIVVAPLVTFAVAFFVAREWRSYRLHHDPARVQIVRTPSGGFVAKPEDDV